MIRVSRAGRKEQIRRVVYQEWKRNKGQPIECWRIARRVGLKSSTNVKNMCRELAHDDDNIMLAHVDGVLGLVWQQYEQADLPERFIIVNGQSCRVADWVFSGEEYRHAI